jgi:molybdate transport system substrate-binding protein
VAIAVPAGVARPDVCSEPALRAAVLEAARIGYSTGPSGVALLQLFARWGLLEPLRERLVQVRPGVPVAALLASGQADLGFQQLSELKDEPGIAMLGTMPPGLEIVTTFSGAVGAHSTRAAEAREALDFMASPAADDLRSLHGMTRPT